MEGYLLSKLVDPFLSKLANYALTDEHTSIFNSLDNHLKHLRARSSDFDEQIERAEHSGTKKRKREVVCWLEQVQSIGKEIDALINDIQTRGFVMKFFGEGRAAELDARVSKLLEQSPNSDKLVLDDHEVQGHLLPTKGLVGDGFKEDFEKIWTMLVIEKVKCIGIHGMGGVGKTTLAKHINNRLVGEKQHRVVWITISEQFSVPKLQDEMAKDLHIDDMSNLCDEDKWSSRLNTVLSKIKNVVLIFDDVWERIDLMKLGDPFSVEGCRLVITTRSKQVCCQIGCNKTIDVKTLQENEAWVLFKQIHGPDLNLTSEVEIIAKFTVKKCRGLPLGIITLAGSMKGETARHAWSNVLAELEESVMGQHEMGAYVFKVLKLSFDRLGLREKKRNGYSKSQLCFLHCSTYPEDYMIREEELIQRFIVEEYLERNGSRKALLNEGRSILDNLVSACLLERVYFGGLVKMHDLLREMALEVSEGKTKVFDGVKSSLENISKEQIWTADIEKVFLWNVARGIISEMEPPNCPNLSTLSLNRDSWGPSWSLSHSFLSRMQSLCTLDMSRCGIEGLPESLSEVVSLKALLCAGCDRLKYVPHLGKLKKLEELDLSETGMEEVPGGIEELINLKFLSLVGAKHLKPSELILNCTNIQYLLLPDQIDLQGEQVVGLKHVEKFVGRLEDIGEFVELIRNKPELDYNIHVVHQPYNPADFFGGRRINGNHLILSGYDFKKAKDEEQVLISKTKLSHLHLFKCEWQSRKSISEDISGLCDVASLVSLDIDNDEETEWVIWRREEYVDTSISSSPLPLPHPPLFSSLAQLIIKRCKKVKKLGLLPSQFPVLEQLEIEECSEIEEIIMDVGEETRDNGINNVFLPNLEHLYLTELPRLKSICKNATMVCPSIESVFLWGCEELKKLALIFGEEDDSPPPSRLRIELKKGEEEWWEALELGHPTHRHLLKPSFRYIVDQMITDD